MTLAEQAEQVAQQIEFVFGQHAYAETIRQCAAALASQQAVQGEPIGWASDDGRVVSAELVKRYPEHKHTYHIPLYLASPPSREPQTDRIPCQCFDERSRNLCLNKQRCYQVFGLAADGIHSREGGSNG